LPSPCCIHSPPLLPSSPSPPHHHHNSNNNTDQFFMTQAQLNDLLDEHAEHVLSAHDYPFTKASLIPTTGRSLLPSSYTSGFYLVALDFALTWLFHQQKCKMVIIQ
jgi:hypothetical protein